jgi:hypothetical protein
MGGTPEMAAWRKPFDQTIGGAFRPTRIKFANGQRAVSEHAKIAS